MKKYIALDDVIAKELKAHPELEEKFQEELLINAIAKMVIEVRNKANLTQSELAKKANTTQPVIARLEGGKDSRVPSLSLLTRVAAAAHAKLRISLEYS